MNGHNGTLNSIRSYVLASLNSLKTNIEKSTSPIVDAKAAILEAYQVGENAGRLYNCCEQNENEPTHWFISYMWNTGCGSPWIPSHALSTVHPFEWLRQAMEKEANARCAPSCQYTLVNFVPISKNMYMRYQMTVQS